MSGNARFIALVARQHAAFTRSQALQAGFSRQQIQSRCNRGVWRRVDRCVLVIAGSRQTFRQRTMVAVLAAGEGAAASRLTAAHLLGLVKDEPPRIDVVVPYGKRTGTHRSRTIDRRDIAIIDAIPVTRVPRTIADLAAVLPSGDLESVLDDALIKRVVTCEGLRRYLHDRGLENSPGLSALRELLADRDLGALDQELERRFVRLIRRTTLPRPVRQYPWRRYRIDFAYPQWKIAIELDGFETHGTRKALDADLARQNELVLDGWVVLRFTWRQVTQKPGAVIAAIEKVVPAVGFEPTPGSPRTTV